MILLDTNVISEPLRTQPELRAVAWLDGQPLETLFLAAMTVAELRAGLVMLPRGKRRQRLQDSVESQVLPLFVGRVLPFDMNCTHVYANVLSRCRSAGVAISAADAHIAAVAVANGFSVATRDVRPFIAAGLTVINPFVV